MIARAEGGRARGWAAGIAALRAVAQFERGDADREIESGLALQAQWLQRDRAVRSTDQHVGIAADPDRRHSSTPTWTPDCAVAGPSEAASINAASAPIHEKRIMVFSLCLRWNFA